MVLYYLSLNRILPLFQLNEIPISIESVFSHYSLICFNVYPALVLRSVTVCDWHSFRCVLHIPTCTVTYHYTHARYIYTEFPSTKCRLLFLTPPRVNNPKFCFLRSWFRLPDLTHLLKITHSFPLVYGNVSSLQQVHTTKRHNVSGSISVITQDLTNSSDC